MLPQVVLPQVALLVLPQVVLPQVVSTCHMYIHVCPYNEQVVVSCYTTVVDASTYVHINYF